MRDQNRPTPYIDYVKMEGGGICREMDPEYFTCANCNTWRFGGAVQIGDKCRECGSKVAWIERVVSATFRMADEHTIDVLRQLLARAERGEVVGIAFVAAVADEANTGSIGIFGRWDGKVDLLRSGLKGLGMASDDIRTVN